MFDLVRIGQLLPTIEAPALRLTLKDKLKWTLLVLIVYFVLGSIIVWGVDPNVVARLEFLEIIFGSKMGSIITLGIGPIVTASIILQMLVGSKIINWDLRSEEGQMKFSTAQKLLTIFFCFFEAIAFTLSGAVPPSSPAFTWIVILQLAMGGILIIFLDEVCGKWGIGSGVSLFIAAGVSKTIFVRIFTPYEGGIISSVIRNLSIGNPLQAALDLLPLISTIVVFGVVIFAQAMKIEIPIAFSLPFGKFAARRWPLRFIYTSNIPVILTAALLANIRAMGSFLYQRGIPIFGEFDEAGNPISGLAYFLTPPHNTSLSLCAIFAAIFAILFGLLAAKHLKKYVLRSSMIGGVIGFTLGTILINLGFLNLTMFHFGELLRGLIYMLVMVVGATIFSIFWVNTAGMDPKSVAEQFKSAYLMIPGFRRDPRIIERVLEKYIPPLAVLGGAFVGFLAGFADLTASIGTGTGILLTAIIILQFYESIAAQHLEDMHPAIRRFMGR
jgi:preprotein translocase subunit SecY